MYYEKNSEDAVSGCVTILVVLAFFLVLDTFMVWLINNIILVGIFGTSILLTFWQCVLVGLGWTLIVIMLRLIFKNGSKS